MDIHQRKEKGAALIEKMMGPQPAAATRAAWRRISPDFENYVVEFLAGEIWSRPTLDLKSRSLVTIAALAAMGRPRALDLNVRMAIKNGASREEITETLLQIAPYAGFPAAWEALATLDEIYAEAD